MIPEERLRDQVAPDYEEQTVDFTDMFAGYGMMEEESGQFNDPMQPLPEQYAGLGRQALQRIFKPRGKQQPVQLESDPENLLPSIDELERGVSPAGGQIAEVPEEIPQQPVIPEGDPTLSRDEMLQAEMPTQGLTGRTERRNINLDHFEREDTKALIELVNKAEGGFADRPIRQVKSHEETIARAKAYEGLDQILNKAPDEGWQTEELVALYKIMEGQAEELMTMGKGIAEAQANNVQVSDEVLAQYDLLNRQFVATQELASGTAAHAGRLLNSFQAIAKAGNSRQYYENLSTHIKMNGGKQNIIEKAQAMADADDLHSASKVARQTWQEKTWEYIVATRYNLMLSSIRTHAANIGGSVLTGLYEIPVKGGAVAFNQLEYLWRKNIPGVTPLPAGDRMLFSEGVSEVQGIVKGTWEGLKLAKRVAAGEELGAGKVMQESGIRYDVNNLPETTAGKIATTPTRMLEAEDAFFRTVYMNQRLHALAERKARSEFGDSPEYAEAYARYLEDPTEDMLVDAKQYAAKLTFTNDPDIYGKIVGSAAKAISSLREQNAFFHVLVPFVNTPANIAGYALEVSQLGSVVAPKRFLNKLTGSPEERADAISRIGIAAGMFYLLHDMYLNGEITGTGPGSITEKMTWAASGWQPNSVLIGDTYYALDRAEPLGMAVGIIASTMDMYYNSDSNTSGFEAVLGGVLSTAALLSDRSMLSSLSDFMDIDSPKRFVSWAAGTATSYSVPALARDFRYYQDPYVREMSYDGTVDGAMARVTKQWKNAIPGFSETMPPKVDVNGDYVMMGGNEYYRSIVPIRKTTAKQDPVAAAYMHARISVRRPDSNLSLQGTGVPIDLLAIDNYQGWIYHEYQKMVGKRRREIVGEFVEGGGYGEMVEEGMGGPDSEGADIIRNLVNLAKRAADAEFLEWLEGMEEYQPKIAGVPVGEPIKLSHVYTFDEYAEAIGIAKELDRAEYQIKKLKEIRAEGFYKVDKPKPDIYMSPQGKKALEDVGVPTTF